MDGGVMVSVDVVIDDVMRALGHRSHPAAQLSDAGVLTVAVVAARSFRHHQERARQVMQGMRYLSGRLSVSRFDRRLPALGAWVRLRLAAPGEVVAVGEAFPLDSLPLPVCRRVRAGRCRTGRGAASCGSCAATREEVCGWRRPPVGTPEGVPVAFELLPASLRDLTPVHALTAGLPDGASVSADKADNSAQDEARIPDGAGVRPGPSRRATLQPNLWTDKRFLRAHRKAIERLNSQWEAMGLQRLRARTHVGFEIKGHASLLALVCANAS